MALDCREAVSTSAEYNKQQNPTISMGYTNAWEYRDITCKNMVSIRFYRWENGEVEKGFAGPCLDPQNTYHQDASIFLPRPHYVKLQGELLRTAQFVVGTKMTGGLHAMSFSGGDRSKWQIRNLGLFLTSYLR